MSDVTRHVTRYAHRESQTPALTCPDLTGPFPLRGETDHHFVGLRTRETGGTGDGMMSLRRIEVAA